jgi:hypothetical protein
MTNDEERNSKQMLGEPEDAATPGICFVIRPSNFVIDSRLRISFFGFPPVPCSSFLMAFAAEARMV